MTPLGKFRGSAEARRRGDPAPAGRPTAALDRERAGTVAEKSWHEAYAKLVAIAGAGSSEDLDRLGRGFGQARRTLRAAIVRAKRNPMTRGTVELPGIGTCRSILGDEELDDALGRIFATLRDNPFFCGPEPTQRAIEVAGKIRNLIRAGSLYVSRRDGKGWSRAT